MNKNSTRYFSNFQEKQVAKRIGGKIQSNSGATIFCKGDIKTDNWLLEAKTCEKEKNSFTIKREWLDKLEEESYAMNKDYFSLVFNFGKFNNSKNYYIINERIFKQLKNLTED